MNSGRFPDWFLDARRGPVWATLVVLLVVAAAPFTGAAPLPFTLDSDCGPAGQLTELGYPQRAIAEVDRINVPLDSAGKKCLSTRHFAAARVAFAEKLALDAKAQSANTEHREAALSTVKEALKLDQENAVALDVKSSLEKPGFWSATNEGWANFTKAVVTPAAAMAVPMVGVLAGLLVLARVIAAWRPRWPGRTSAAKANRMLYGGWVASAVGAIGMVWSLSSPDVLKQALPVLVAAFAAAGLLGTALTAAGTARKLRVGVEVHKGNSEDAQSAAHLLTLLHEFGSSPPRGLERPSGPDVQALTNVLANVKIGWLGSALSAVSSLVGWTPWRVSVDHESDTVVTVTIARNGQFHTSQHLDLAQLAEDGRVDPAIYVAAIVVTTLATPHTGFEGLCGATDWRSLGLQYAASRMDKEAALPLLTKAVARDPGNWLANVDLHYCQHRKATTDKELAPYDEWLKTAIEHITGGWDKNWPAKPGFAVLLVRLRLTQAAVRINRVFVGPPSSTEQARLNARKAIALLCDAAASLEEKLPHSELGAWLERVRWRAGAMASAFGADEIAENLPPSSAATATLLNTWATHEPVGPSAHYSRACAEATPGLTIPMDKEKTAKEVAKHLQRARLGDGLAAWIVKDPQLEWFRATSDYDDFRPTPASDLLAGTPFAPRRAALERLGLDTPGRIAEMAEDDLASMLGIVPSAARELIDASAVCASLTSEDLKRFAVQATLVLVKHDLVSPARLAALGKGEVEARFTRVRKEMAPFIPSTLAESFDGWLQTLEPSDGSRH